MNLNKHILDGGELDTDTLERLREEQSGKIDPGNIQEIETPDQLEERGLSMITEEEPTPEEQKPIEKMDLVGKHPNHVPSLEFQIEFLQDLISLTNKELTTVEKQMQNIEYLVELYPKLASVNELNLWRKFSWKVFILTAQLANFENEIVNRKEMLRKEKEQKNPKSPGFLKKFLIAWRNAK